MSGDLKHEELPPPVQLVALAVNAAVAANFAEAAWLLASVDESSLRALYLSRMAATRGLPSVPSPRPESKVPAPEQLKLHNRNRWRCRYSACGFVPVIDVKVLQTLARAGLFTYYTAQPRKTWHQLGYTYVAVVDHVVPRTVDPDEWTTCCTMCNLAKSNVALADLQWIWDRSPPERGWSGLRDRLPALRTTLRQCGRLV